MEQQHRLAVLWALAPHADWMTVRTRGLKRLWLRARAPQRTRATRRPAGRHTDMAVRRARSQASAAVVGMPLRTG